jgi:hypothetical protein
VIGDPARGGTAEDDDPVLFDGTFDRQVHVPDRRGNGGTLLSSLSML